MLGFLSKQDGAYALTPESATFLNRRSPAYLGSISNFLLNDRVLQNFANLTQVVKKGGSVVGNGDNQKPNDEFWVSFAKQMAPLTFPSRTFIAKFTEMSAGRPAKILDIAAGHGMFGIEMARQNPNAQVTALDWAPVLEVAKENARAAGVSDRVTMRPGSAFTTDFGHDYDYILFTNFFHHFDPPTCEQLMRKAHAALKPGGKSITLDFIPNQDRISPRTAAMFSLIMLATTDNGDAYTFAEYQQMFRNAGFKSTTLHPVEGMPQQVLVSEK
jgi:2-polyprenyl-3-methyl-5-hydroxy-6-metoxy-1,4-benzoquinol methylase